MEKHLAAAEALTNLLENKFRILGFRFGLDPLLGLLPWLGDAIALFLSLYLIWIAKQLRLPEEVIREMLRNILLDFIIGVIPVVGTVGDFFFRANSKNFRILRRYLPQVVEARVISS